MASGVSLSSKVTTINFYRQKGECKDNVSGRLTIHDMENINNSTSLPGQTSEMKEANGGPALSYSSIPSMIHEIMGRITAWPCSGW